MKSLIAIITALFLGFSTNGTNIDVENISFKQKGLDLITEIDYLAEDEEAMKIFINDDELLQQIKEIGAYNYNKPKTIYEWQNSSNIINQYVEQTLLQNPKISERSKTLLKNRVQSSFMSIINASSGIDAMTITSILNSGDVFKAKLDTDIKMYIYKFDDIEYSFIVNFYNHDNGIVGAGASIILNEEFNKLETIEDFEEFFGKISLEKPILIDVTE